MRTFKNDYAQTEEYDYPYLGIDEVLGTIVLFTAPSSGVCIHQESGAVTVGEYIEDWNECELFTKYTGSITMEND